MIRILVRLVGLAVVTVVATGGLWLYVNSNDDRDRIIEEQARQIETLENIATRLQAERRVADILVTGQQRDSEGALHTTLLFVEYGRDGEPLAPKRFEVVGDRVHVETQLIKFERHFVREGDPLRGKSLVLFSSIYGSATPPEKGLPVDEPGRAPKVYRGADPRQSEYEQELWREFWKLMSDTQYANSKGVRVAQGETVWGIFEPDKLYTITLESAGGLSLTNEPLKPIFREALSSFRRDGDPATAPAPGAKTGNP
jgi:hypothetical protein